MTHLGRKLSSLFFPLFLLVSLLAASGCGLVQEYFPLPTAWEFPTLTPRPTLTGTPELTSTATSTLTPTEVTPAQAGTGLSAPWIGIEPENVSQIDLIVEAGRGMPQQMTFAPDDSLLAVATTNGVYLHDPSTLANTLSVRTNRVQHCLALSASRIASGDEHGVVKTWDRAGELQMELNAATQPVLALAFSPDGAILAGSAWDGSIKLWDMKDGSLFQTLAARLRPAETLAFSADGSLLYAWAQKESVQVWNIEEGASLEDVYIGKDGRGFLPISGAFDQQGALFAANYGRTIRVYRLQNGTILRQFNDLQDQAKSVTISPDGLYLGAIQTNRVSVWDLDTGGLSSTPEMNEPETPLLLAFPGQSISLFTISKGLQRWAAQDPAANDLILAAESPGAYHTSIIAASRMSAENDIFFLGLQGSISTYSIDQGTLSSLLPPITGDFTSHALHPKLLAALGTQQGEILLHDEEGVRTLPSNHEGPVRCLAFSADGSLLASCGEDGMVLIHSLEEPPILLHRFELETIPLSVLLPEGNDSLLVLTRDGIEVWSFADQALIRRIPGSSMTLSEDGALLAAADSANGSPVVQFYRLATGEQFGSVPRDGNQLALSPDHMLLAVAGKDLTLWSVIDGNLLQRLSDINIFGTLQFSPDSKWLILTTWDGSIRVWGIPE